MRSACSSASSACRRITSSCSRETSISSFASRMLRSIARGRSTAVRAIEIGQLMISLSTGRRVATDRWDYARVLRICEGARQRDPCARGGKGRYFTFYS